MLDSPEEMNSVEGGSLRAVLNFATDMSLDEMAQKIGLALGLDFLDDNESKYEEYPAVIAHAAGLQFALLGAPLPEHDLRVDKTSNYQFVVQSDQDGLDYSSPLIDMSSFFARVIKARVGLSCAPF